MDAKGPVNVVFFGWNGTECCKIAQVATILNLNVANNAPKCVRIVLNPAKSGIIWHVFV